MNNKIGIKRFIKHQNRNTIFLIKIYTILVVIFLAICIFFVIVSQKDQFYWKVFISIFLGVMLLIILFSQNHYLKQLFQCPICRKRIPLGLPTCYAIATGQCHSCKNKILDYTDLDKTFNNVNFCELTLEYKVHVLKNKKNNSLFNTLLALIFLLIFVNVILLQIYNPIIPNLICILIFLACCFLGYIKYKADKTLLRCPKCKKKLQRHYFLCQKTGRCCFCGIYFMGSGLGIAHSIAEVNR